MKERTQSIIYLLEILTKYSDEDHILNAREIQDHLLNEYGVTVDRRTLYEHIKRLKDTGYEISSFEDNGKGCYLVERQFEKGEVLLLCNAIHASHFISSKQSNDLIKKLLKTQSKYQQAEYHDKAVRKPFFLFFHRLILLPVRTGNIQKAHSPGIRAPQGTESSGSARQNAIRPLWAGAEQKT